MVVIMNAPLPIPSNTTVSGKTQHEEATIAEGRLAIIGFKLEIFIPSCSFTIFFRLGKIFC
jgi:hypothetical protein